jgi:hypothetical protein
LSRAGIWPFSFVAASDFVVDLVYATKDSSIYLLSISDMNKIICVYFATKWQA